jgi:Flp pilus assembly protein TadG
MREKVEDCAMTGPIGRMRRFVAAFCRDTSGIILPYVALLLVAFIGISALAVDTGRHMSQQTQMQAIADALALAGARELNQQAGAQGRATNAINNLVSNGLTGLGYSGSITHTVAFYSALNAAATGGGTTTTVDTVTKYVGVTVSPVSIARMFPIGGTTMSSGAQAIAGFTSQSFCDVPPVFICNPYETAGMSDSDATAALRTALSNTTTQQQQLRLDPTKVGPGQFGYLVPPDNCNGASCLETWIAKSKPNTCYQTASVSLNTGFKNSVTDGFNVRFDIYVGNLKAHSGEAAYAPAVNVRKGYQTTGAVCSPTVPAPYYTTKPGFSLSVIPDTTITPVTGDTDNTNKNCNKTPNPCVLKNVQSNVVTQVKSWLTSGHQPLIIGAGANAADIPSGETVTLACSVTDATVAGSLCNAAGPNTLTMSAAANGKHTGVSLIIGWPTSGLPMDTNLVGNSNTFGNGQWDCDNYWKVNHPGVDKPADIAAKCSSPAATTVSRYNVYRSEIDHGLHTAFSWPGSRAAGGESGSPLCAPAGIDASPTQTDRRTIFAAVINCLAQGPFSGGSNATNIPVAGFGKFFMTQPVGADPNTPSAVIGEMSGIAGLTDNVKILNQVQLYR